MRVFLIEDHAPTVRVIESLLGIRGIRVVGTAATCGEALRLAERVNPDVVLLDLCLPDGPGLRLIRPLKADGAAVIVLSMHEDKEYINFALHEGADGYVFKSEPATLLRTLEQLPKRAVTD